VLDLVLPGRDGLTVLERLRSARPGVPVVILSGRAELATKLRGFELGATDYLTKPFSVAELVARVRIHLRRAAPEQDAVLRVGPLALDLIRRQVRHGDATFDLSDREFKLLRCLLTRAGSVVTREQLLAESGASTSIPARTSSTSACAGCAASSGRRRSRPSATSAIAPRPAEPAVRRESRSSRNGG
jgi:DNA-binding response OmpR family regulator